MTKKRLEKLDTKTIRKAYNDYLDDMNRSDDQILLPDYFDEIMRYDDPLDILDRAFYGNYKSGSYAYGYDEWGNIKSYSSEQDVRDEILADDDFVKAADEYLGGVKNEVQQTSKE